MTDIVDRLREQGEWRSDKAWDGCPIAEEAAAEITRLREENARLREALEPFAPDSQWIDPAIPDGRPIDAMFLAGELRAAAAAIREGGKDDAP